MPAAQPVLVCLQALLFKLQPGMTLTHKPPPTTVTPPASPVIAAIRATAVALAVAVPLAAVAVFAARSRGAPLPLSSQLARQPVALAASATTGSSNRDALTKPSAEHERAPAAAAHKRRTEAPLWQQVAFAKEVTMQLRGSVWHGLRHSGAGGRSSSYPAVFHIAMAEGVLPAPPLLNLHGSPWECASPWTLDAARSVFVQPRLTQIRQAFCGVNQQRDDREGDTAAVCRWQGDGHCCAVIAGAEAAAAADDLRRDLHRAICRAPARVAVAGVRAISEEVQG